MNTGIPSAVPHDDAAGESHFLFIGDALALDLVNTEQVVRGKPRDLLATPGDLALWWHAAQNHHPSTAEVRESDVAVPIDATSLAAAKTLRAALRGLFGALIDRVPPDPRHIEALNTSLRTGAHALALTPAGDLTPVYETLPNQSPMLFAVALSAMQLLRGADRQRLHRCGNNRCVLMFYDTTKSATRRWCSVGCMDRARSARRYQAAKQHSQASTEEDSAAG
jgi:predicted RNA-binding Zn ribbon-like protein